MSNQAECPCGCHAACGFEPDPNDPSRNVAEHQWLCDLMAWGLFAPLKWSVICAKCGKVEYEYK